MTARSVVVSLAAAAVAGLVVLGVGGRVAMRGIAVLAGLEREWSLGGTLEVIGAGGLYGLAGGVPYLLLQRWAPPRPWRGPLLGTIHLVLVIGYLNVVRADLAELAASMWPLALGTFLPTFLLYGVTVEWAAARLGRKRLSRSSLGG